VTDYTQKLESRPATLRQSCTCSSYLRTYRCRPAQPVKGIVITHRSYILVSDTRTRFIQVYHSLPPDAQQLLVQKQLVPLLDVVPKDRRKKAIDSATEMQTRYAHMPSLNLKAKKSEICTLLLELSRDSKRSIIKERSRREELISEAVDSLAQWLNDVWKVIYEYRTNFKLAHGCLLFACDALDQIGSVCGG
jgi:hypothetical protein